MDALLILACLAVCTIGIGLLVAITSYILLKTWLNRLTEDRMRAQSLFFAIVTVAIPYGIILCVFALSSFLSASNSGLPAHGLITSLSLFLLTLGMPAVFTAAGIYFFLLKRWWHQLAENQRQRRNGTFAVLAAIITLAAVFCATMAMNILFLLAMPFRLHRP